jgi:hypothetical protein
MHIAIGIAGIDEALHYPVRDRLRLSPLHEQALDPQGAIDAAPTVSRPIDNHKDVAREQGSGDGLDFSGVASIFPIARDKDPEALIGELFPRLQFTLWQSASDIPSLLWCQRQLRRKPKIRNQRIATFHSTPSESYYLA